ncbi:MAG: hypothetical protein WCI57_01995 [Candidatus Berkelbacteria bacterium]
MILISTDEAKQKLRNLAQYIPNQEEILYDFGRLLADRLNPELYPIGFVMTYATTLHDMETGISDVDGKPIQSQYVGCRPVAYAVLSSLIGGIASAIFPEEFAKEVIEQAKAIGQIK